MKITQDPSGKFYSILFADYQTLNGSLFLTKDDSGQFIKIQFNPVLYDPDQITQSLQTQLDQLQTQIEQLPTKQQIDSAL